MNEGFLLERDAINGKDGSASITLDGTVHKLFRIKKLSTEGQFQKSDFKVVGTRIIQSRVNGIKHTGTLDYYYGTPYFLDILVDYQNGKRLPYFTAQVENDDTTATVGKQTITLYYCLLDKVTEAMLDADSDTLVCNTGFTFTKLEILNRFNEDPESYGA